MAKQIPSHTHTHMGNLQLLLEKAVNREVHVFVTTLVNSGLELFPSQLMGVEALLNVTFRGLTLMCPAHQQRIRDLAAFLNKEINAITHEHYKDQQAQEGLSELKALAASILSFTHPTN